METTGSETLNATAQALLRMVIGSYFLAVALGLIPGTDLGILFTAVLPAPYDSALATGLVFALAFMVMLGHATRGAALVMALITFYASYLTMLSMGVADELGSFWRDLALIAALLLTYSGPTRGAAVGPAAETPEDRRFAERIDRALGADAALLQPVVPRRVRPLTPELAERRARRPAPALDFATLHARAQPVTPATPAATPAAAPASVTSLGQRAAGWLLEECDNIFAEDPAEFTPALRPVPIRPR